MRRCRKGDQDVAGDGVELIVSCCLGRADIAEEGRHLKAQGADAIGGVVVEVTEVAEVCSDLKPLNLAPAPGMEVDRSTCGVVAVKGRGRPLNHVDAAVGVRIGEVSSGKPVRLRDWKAVFEHLDVAHTVGLPLVGTAHGDGDVAWSIALHERDARHKVEHLGDSGRRCVLEVLAADRLLCLSCWRLGDDRGLALDRYRLCQRRNGKGHGYCSTALCRELHDAGLFSKPVVLHTEFIGTCWKSGEGEAAALICDELGDGRAVLTSGFNLCTDDSSIAGIHNLAGPCACWSDLPEGA